MKLSTSILIPVQNEEGTLDRCFESLQKQTYQDFEIICIDNGSRDRSLEIIRKWQKIFKKNRFHIIENKNNMGITKALNQGLEIITTEFTARIDGDDWWDPTKLEKQLGFMASHPECGITGTNYINFRGDVETRISAPETDSDIRKAIIKKNPFAHSCVVFRTELIRNAGGYDATVCMGQDYELWLRCMPLCKFYNIQEFLCHRSINGGISFDKQADQMRQCMKTQIKYIRKYRMSCVNYLNLIEPIFVILTPNLIKKLKRKLIG